MKVRVLGSVVVCVFLLAGCGDDASEPTPTPTPSAPDATTPIEDVQAPEETDAVTPNPSPDVSDSGPSPVSDATAPDEDGGESPPDDTSVVEDAGTTPDEDAAVDEDVTDDEEVVDDWDVPWDDGAYCDNDADLWLHEDTAALTAARQSCGATCIVNETEEEQLQCFIDCISEATGLSDDCANCYGEDALCTLAGGCVFACLDTSTPDKEAECTECRDAAGCNESLSVCTGLWGDTVDPPDDTISYHAVIVEDAYAVDGILVNACSSPDTQAEGFDLDAVELQDALGMLIGYADVVVAGPGLAGDTGCGYDNGHADTSEAKGAPDGDNAGGYVSLNRSKVGLEIEPNSPQIQAGDIITVYETACDVCEDEPYTVGLAKDAACVNDLASPACGTVTLGESMGTSNFEVETSAW